MPIIHFLPHPELCPEGKDVKVNSGTSVLEAALDAEIEIEHACGGVSACTTCHCIIRQGFDSLEEANDHELDMLDKAWGLELYSRLACQARIAEQDITVEIPKYSINHAKEEH